MVCDRVSILYKGKLRRIGAVNEMVTGGHVVIIAEDVKADDADINKLKAISQSVDVAGKRITVITDPTSEAKNVVLDWIRQHGGNLLSIAPVRRSLEDIFYETVHEGEVEAGTAFTTSMAQMTK